MRMNTVRAAMVSFLAACASVCTAEAPLLTVDIMTDISGWNGNSHPGDFQCHPLNLAACHNFNGGGLQ